MKTHEYVKKYKLSLSDKFNHSDFYQDLASEFIGLLELNKANDNIKGFENAVRCIRMKFDAISNKTVGVMPEKLWNYFFATVVVKLREELCPKDVDRKRQMQEQKKREWEQRKEQKEWEQKQFSDFFFFLFQGIKSDKPIASFHVLGISEAADENEIKSAYKKLANIHHPDKGGKQDVFIEITDSKNKCLQWLSSQ